MRISALIVLSAMAATAILLLVVACGMLRSPDFVRWETFAVLFAAGWAFALGYVCGKQDTMQERHRSDQ